ncbi:hypothetical protein HAHE_00730 [Haloferula helveola]|uniref:Autotransporter-associated beta strand repeat-containing protein n=1 Tax=Haloferula helveola TaxID=490095 RepID=A0ABN6GXW6_9BACT|nr:hypothetical protein HAHE_00730 [Haloferula helveola]
MKKLLLPTLILLAVPASGETLVTYLSGVTPTAGTTGAADPTAQGWTYFGATTNNFVYGGDSTLGGWRITDGSTGGGTTAFYQAAIPGSGASAMQVRDWTASWTVAVNADAASKAGGGVDNYYAAPNNGRQANNAMWIELASGLRFILLLTVDANDDIFINDGTTSHAITVAGSQLSEELGTGSPLANYITFTLTYSGGVATLTDSLGGNRVVATSGTGTQDRVVWGATGSPSQGSTVWNEVTLEVADPVTQDLTWTGANGSAWDIDTTVNWELPDTTPSTFTDDDNVTFDDTGATGAVVVSGSVSPNSVTVNNDALAYTLSGDPVGGIATLTKQGPGSLTLASNCGYVGGTSIEGGTITAGDGATAGEIGEGPVTLATGSSLTISRSDDLDYKATQKLRDVSGDGDIVLDGGGLLWIYPGGGLDFNSADTWAGFSGDITIVNGSELQSIRNGATGRGTGSLILGDGGSSGALSPIEGNWTWTNPIVAVGSANAIINRSAGADRSLKLQGPISGAGNLTFQDATSAMNDANRGFVITNDVTLTGTLTIDVGAPVRIGGVPGEVDVSGTGLDADSFGSLGTTTVVNDGILTFSRTDAHTIDSAISGIGAVRIGMPSTANRGDTSTQVVTIADNTKTYDGTTDIESGTLLVNGTLPNSFVDVNPEGTLGGTGTVSLSTLVYGNLAPGASVGTLAFGDEVIFVADSSYTWEISDFTGSAGAGYDTFTAASIDFEGTDTNPNTIVISPLSVVNFSEAPATFTIATSAAPITVFDPAGIAIDDSAFASATGSAGSWAAQLSGDSLSVELVYTPGSPDNYANWIDGFFPGEADPLIIGFDADPDGDGIGNGVENFLGTAPDEFNAGLTVTGSTANSLTATHTQTNDPASDVTGGYEWSSDLQSWNGSGDTDSNGVTVTIATVVTDDQAAPLNDTVEVTATISGGPTTRLFLRATATQTP